MQQPREVVGVGGFAEGPEHAGCDLVADGDDGEWGRGGLEGVAGG